MADVISFSVNSLQFSSSFSCSSSLNSYHPNFGPILCQSSSKKNASVSECSYVVSSDFVSPYAIKPRKQLSHFKVQAALTETEQPKWWEKNAEPNMVDIRSSQEFSDALIKAGDRLVIVDFYGIWCASCRALYPKLCRTAKEHPEIFFLKVNFDENKSMCMNMNIRVLPYFHFYKGADGLLDSFSCSLAKFQKIRDAIQLHSTSHHSIYPPTGVRDINISSSKDVLSRSSN